MNKLKKLIPAMGLVWLLSPAANAEPFVLMQTSMGDVKIELDQENAPLTVQNFLRYVEDGSYNETIFHRVIAGFMVQGGAFTQSMDMRDQYGTVKNESKNGLSNQPYTIAMARTSSPHSATRQFFINVADNEFLDGASNKWGYAVFGKVVEGSDVVEKISTVETATDPKSRMRDVPVEAVVLKSIKVLD